MRYYIAAAVVKLAGIAQLQGQWFGLTSRLLVAHLAADKPLSEFDLDDIPEDFAQMTVRHYLDSPLNRALLPFKRFPVILGDNEAHSAGCIRCLRTLYEPTDFYSVDTARTALINTASDKQTPLSKRACSSGC